MYAVNVISNPRNLVLPGDNLTFKISVLSGKSIFCIDAKAITGHVDVQEVQSGIFE